MKKSFKVILSTLICLGGIALLTFYMSTHEIAVLEPKGMIGEKELDLLMTASLLMLIVVIPVFILTFFFAWRYREGSKAKHTPDWEHNYIAEYCWWGVPVVIIIILAVITWRSTHELNPFSPIENGKKSLTIQVVALDWKWLFLYPEQGIATINFVQFPEKTPINFAITSDAPMNSFWIPQLGGQIYAMPGMRTKLHLIANEEGVFRGVSANISGRGFAGMTFNAKSCTDAEFDQWVGEIRSSSKQLNMDSYRLLVSPTEQNPVEYYRLTQTDLFDQILMQYMAPKPNETPSPMKH